MGKDNKSSCRKGKQRRILKREVKEREGNGEIDLNGNLTL